MSGLVSDAEMAALRETAALGFQSDVTIYKRVTNVTADGQQSGWATTGTTVKGWLYSTPTPQITIVAAEESLVNTYRLFVPVNTDIESGDQVEIGGARFTVSDTTAESTHLPLLRVSLRRVE